MSISEKSSCDLLIVINSLVAEGCPQLALQLTRYWSKKKFKIEILYLSEQSDELKKEFLELGVPMHFINIGNGSRRYLKLIYYSFKLCKEIKPKSLLSFLFGWHAFIAIGAQIAGVKYICSHVGNLPPSSKKVSFEKFKILVQMGRPFTTKIISCSEYIRMATIKDFKLSRKEVVTIYNACDLERFINNIRSNNLIKKKLYRLGMVARFEQHKDQPTLIKAAKEIASQSIPIEVWLIGDGSKRKELEDLIQTLNLNHIVKLLGSRRDIPNLLNDLDIFVFSAKPDEGFGIALAEAMAAEVPIIASNVGACREVLDEGRLGQLVEPFNPKALAEGIIEIINSPNIAIRKAAKAKGKSIDAFSIKKMANAYKNELHF
tara:strand:+ start:18516 stop:19640 length:1125 start_codon:yes stop_codon:yes gene_type:complete